MKNHGGYSTDDGYGHCRLEPVDIRIVCCMHLFIYTAVVTTR